MDQEKLWAVLEQLQGKIAKQIRDMLGQEPLDQAQFDTEESRQRRVKALMAAADSINMSDEAQHEVWIKQHLAAGWRYGKQFDAEAKTHPNLMSWSTLNQVEQGKIRIFRLVALAGVRLAWMGCSREAKLVQVTEADVSKGGQNPPNTETNRPPAPGGSDGTKVNYSVFTDRARKVMQLANQEAQRFNHDYIGTEHVLLGLIKEGQGVASIVFRNLNIDLRKIRLEVEKLICPGPEMLTLGKLPQTPKAKKMLEYAIEESRQCGHSHVGTEHILLGLLRDEEGVAAQVFLNLGLKLEEVRHEVLDMFTDKPQEPSVQEPQLLPGSATIGSTSHGPPGNPGDRVTMTPKQTKLDALSDELVRYVTKHSKMPLSYLATDSDFKDLEKSGLLQYPEVACREGETREDPPVIFGQIPVHRYSVEYNSRTDCCVVLPPYDPGFQPWRRATSVGAHVTMRDPHDSDGI